MNSQTAAALADLLHADRAIMAMYDDAAEKISAEASALLTDALADHRKHEELLVQALEAAEMQQVEASEDVRAIMDGQSLQIKAAREEGDVLESLVVAERVNSMLYETASREELPEELSELINEHHADVRMHVSILEERVPHLVGSRAARHGISCMTGGMTDDRNPDDFE